jgi:pimeloyl-ACP methyl ester carboxylesterase
MKVPKVKVNDIEIYYEIHGDGPPLIMIYGYGGTSESWSREFIEGLTSKYKLILFDNRGAGRSDKPDIEYSVKMMADDTSDLMAALDISNAHILGISMGGMIAQEIALSYPEKVRSLILCSTACRGVDIADEKFLDFVMGCANGVFPKMSAEEMMRWSWEVCFTPEYVQENEDMLRRNMSLRKYPTPPVGWIRQAQALYFDSYERLPDIKAPTLVLVGEKDVLLPPDRSKVLAERIPGARLKVFKNSAHVFPNEVTEQAVSEILNFLRMN